MNGYISRLNTYFKIFDIAPDRWLHGALGQLYLLHCRRSQNETEYIEGLGLAQLTLVFKPMYFVLRQ
jgi:hypothetical protein